MYDVDAIKQKTDLAAIIAADLGEGKKHGRWLMWKCPFHNDRDPSLAVGPDNQVYKCFGCGKSGDVISWGIDYRGLEFKKWCELLGGDLMAIPTKEKPVLRPRYEIDETEWPEQDWQDRLIKVMVECHALLFEPIGLHAKLWLNGPERCLEDSVIERHWIGYNPVSRKIHGHWIYAGIVIPHYSKQLNTIFGLKIRLSSQGRQDWLAHWLKRNPDKKPAEAKIPKYVGVTGNKPNIFNVDSLEYGEDDGFFYMGTGRYKEDVFVAEGEFDCVVLDQFANDLVGSVTLGGAGSRLPTRWLPALSKAKRFFLCLDADKAGRNGLAYWGELVGNRGRLAVLPDGIKDITELAKAGYDIRAWVINEMRY